MATVVHEKQTSIAPDPRHEREWLSDHLRARGQVYFAEFDARPLQVRLSRTLARKMSTVYEFTLQSDHQEHAVLAKINKVRRNDDRRLANLRENNTFDRPRIMPWITHRTSARMEHDALAAIHGHFDRLEDPRLGAVRVLDLLPEMGGIVVEKLDYHNLRDLLARPARLRGSHRETVLRDAVHNSGAWLREFHRLSPPPHAITRQSSRAEFLELFREFIAFLANSCGRERFFADLGRRVASAVHRFLPAELPLALSHGDYGPRNVLVGPHSEAVGFDTRARCHAPVYEDLSYFLFMLEYDTPDFFAPGLVTSARLTVELRDAFLRGYYGAAPIPRGALALFELQSMLDKWAPMVLGYHEATGLVRTAKRVRLAAMSPWFARHARRLMSAMDRANV